MISVAFAVRRTGGGAPQNARRSPPRPMCRAASFWGWVTGFTSMIAHAGGPPFQIYVMPQRLPRESSSARARSCSRSINWIKVPPYLALGQFTAENLATAGGPVSGGDRLHLGGVLAGAARLGPALLHDRLCAAGPRRGEAGL